MNLVISALVGIVVGILARFFYPGPVNMGLIMTMVLGVAGSLLAGFIASRGAGGFRRGGLLASILGAMLLIFLGRVLGIG